MKTKLSLLFFFLTLFSMRAATITVSNDPEIPADYDDLQSAHDAAQGNDTIHVLGTGIPYTELYISKPLTILGDGNSLLERKGTLIVNLFISEGASGSTLKNCSVSSMYFSEGEHSNLTMVNCDVVALASTGADVTVQDSLFYNSRMLQIFTGFNFTNTLFSNNLLGAFNLVGILDNCVFRNNYIGQLLFTGGAVLENNIIAYSLQINESSPFVMQNNLISSTAELAIQLTDHPPLETDNIFTEELGFVADYPSFQPHMVYHIAADYIEMVNYASPDNYSEPNLNLLETSLGKNAGTDGTDIGIFGGEYPYIEGDVSESGLFRYFPTSEEFAEGSQQDPIAVDQVLCTGARVLDLVATGTDIKWYKYDVGGSPLAAAKKLVTGTYYVTETTDVESDRLAVEITIDHCSSITSPLCGSTLLAKNSVIYAKTVPGATQYRFRISDGSATETLDKATRTFNLAETAIGRYNQAYTIDVATMVGGEWSGYGPSCALTTPAVSTKIMDSQCGTEITPGTILYADQVPGATQYRFRLTAGASVMTIDRSSRTLKLDMFPYTYGTSYTVDVAVEVDGSFTSYGTSCVVNLATASTKVTDIQCSTNITPDTIIYADLVPGATQYRFRIISGASVMTIDRATRSMKFNMLPEYAYGTTYTIDVSVEVNGTYNPYGTACNVTMAHPATNLVNTVCDTQVTPATILYANLVPGATQYRFRVTAGANVMTIDRATRTLKLNMMPEYIFGTTYTVDVAVEVGGNFNAYGPACNVHLVAPTTNIVDTMCGTQVATNTIIYANLVPGATQYRFRVSDGTTTTTLDRTTRAMKLEMLSESLNGPMYTIDVAVKIDGEFGEYGSACNVYSILPTTQLTDEFCGATVTMETVISVDPIEGADQYGFVVIPEAGNDYASLLLSEGTTFQLSEVPGLIESPTYTILVGAIIDEVPTNAGDPCIVTIESPGARYAMGDSDGTTETQDVLAFPNPFSDAFSLAVLAGSVENVDILVYDTGGRQVEHLTLSPSELRYRKIGDNYSAGLYNVVVTQGSYQKALKVVKK